VSGVWVRTRLEVAEVHVPRPVDVVVAAVDGGLLVGAGVLPLDVTVDEGDHDLGRGVTGVDALVGAVVGLLLVPHDGAGRVGVPRQRPPVPVHVHLRRVVAPALGAARRAGATEDLGVLDVRHDEVTQEHLRGDSRTPSVVHHPRPPVVDDIAVASSGTSRPVGEALVVVLHVHQHAQSELLEVALATGLACLLTGAGEDGEQDRREDRNDRDDNQQFDERKASLFQRNDLFLF